MELPVHLIEEELRVFEAAFQEAVRSNVAMLDRVMQYIVKRKGKQLRPMFVLLAARLCGTVSDTTYRAASLVELLHTATLVHDDVVDDSLERRGFFSVYALWKNKVSVLIGDYLLAKGLLLSLDNGDFRVLQILTGAVRQMSEGELLQMEKSRSLNLDEGVYYDIIRSKTASLLSAACAAGAYSASSNEELTATMGRFGEAVGMAFQIKDDLFDYTAADIGKPTGNDIKEKKLTLPLIYTINQSDRATRRRIVSIVKGKHTKENIAWVLLQVESAGGISYATAQMERYKAEALDILESFPPSPIREGFKDLVTYITERSY